MIGKKLRKKNVTTALNVFYVRKVVSKHNLNREKQATFWMILNGEGSKVKSKGR